MASRQQTYVARARNAMLCLLLLSLLPLTLRAEEVPVPVPLQVKLLLKVLTFDRNFSQKISGALRIAVVYNPGSPTSRQAQLDVIRILDQFTIKKLPIKYSGLAFQDKSTLAQDIKVHHINVLYIMPDNATHLEALLSMSATHQITTITGVPAYVFKGVAVGVDVKENHQPRILINLPAAKSQGNAFEAKLLNMAKVLK